LSEAGAYHHVLLPLIKQLFEKTYDKNLTKMKGEKK